MAESEESAEMVRRCWSGALNTVGAGVEFLLQDKDRMRRHEIALLEQLHHAGMIVYGPGMQPRRRFHVSEHPGQRASGEAASLDIIHQNHRAAGLAVPPSPTEPWPRQAGHSRFSFSYFNTDEEVQSAIAAMAEPRRRVGLSLCEEQ